MGTSESFSRSGFANVMMGALLLGVVLASSSCASSNTAKGAAVGGAGGAVVGGVIGSQTGSTARGAIIGAVVGGATGAYIGHRMDQQAKDLEIAIPGAVVTRVGEGIVVTFASGLLYDSDSEAIRSDAGVNLESLATSLKQYPDTELLIVGHADSRGTEAHNQDLSARRAASASRYLAMQGVEASRVHTSGVGEMEPVASNETEEGRQLNRRIEVAIYADEAARTAAR